MNRIERIYYRVLEFFSQAERPVGIDISNWQGNINWVQVRNAGKTFAFMKATEASGYVDPYFAQNWRDSKNAGVMRSAYHFFRPRVSVQAQIDHFCNVVGRWENGDLQPMLDLEDPGDWAGIPIRQRTDLVLAWLHGVWQRLGAQPIIYASPSFVNDVLRNDPRLREFPLFVAHWTNGPNPIVPAPWPFWTFWQYTETGRCPGVNGNVDLDRFNGSLEMLKRFQFPPRPPLKQRVLTRIKNMFTA